MPHNTSPAPVGSGQQPPVARGGLCVMPGARALKSGAFPKERETVCQNFAHHLQATAPTASGKGTCSEGPQPHASAGDAAFCHPCSHQNLEEPALAACMQEAPPPDSPQTLGKATGRSKSQKVMRKESGAGLGKELLCWGPQPAPRPLRPLHRVDSWLLLPRAASVSHSWICCP